jgi:uncharacterized membrane protein
MVHEYGPHPRGNLGRHGHTRDVLVFASPTGSGYINDVFTEALEYMSLGDCAIATMQYSMIPSSMSLTRTGLAIEQNRALTHTITGYLRGMAAQDRPKFDQDGAMLEVDNFGEVLDLEPAGERPACRQLRPQLDRDLAAGFCIGTPKHRI